CARDPYSGYSTDTHRGALDYW
nr:immunoglobulin heavy chain junction region [Macaca mulatta]MOX96823.1 immunoglobulin heavy chain junction region [Macaca mulatta]